MAVFNRFNVFSESVAEKEQNLGSDTLKVALTNTAPNIADTHFDTLTDLRLEGTSLALDLVTGAGYTAGGTTTTQSSSAQSSGTFKLVVADVVFTATASLGPFRYAFLYNATGGAAATRPIIGWWDYGSAITLASGETFTWDADATNGIMQFVPA